MEKIILISLLSFLISCTSHKSNHKASTEEFQFILDNFKVGKYEASLMTGSQNSERRTELMEKMQATIQNDYEWYIGFVKDTPNGLPVTYHKRLGLTEEEFKELRNLTDNYRMASELEFNLEIINQNSILKFNSEYFSKFFNEFSINTQSETVYHGDKKFYISDTINFVDDNNRIGSKCKGYQWTYQVPKDVDFEKIPDLITKDVILYRISFGKLAPSGKLYLSVKGIEIENGIKNVHFVNPILLSQ